MQRRFQTIDNLDTIATSSSQESKATAQLGGFQPTHIQLRKTGNLNSRPEQEQDSRQQNTLSSSDAVPFGQHSLSQRSSIEHRIGNIAEQNEVFSDRTTILEDIKEDDISYVYSHGTRNSNQEISKTNFLSQTGSHLEMMQEAFRGVNSNYQLNYKTEADKLIA